MKTFKTAYIVGSLAVVLAFIGCRLGEEEYEDPGWGTCWVADADGGSVTKIAPACDDISALNVEMGTPTAVLADPYNDVCWTADGSGRVILLSNRGVINRTLYGFGNPTALGLFPKEGSVWVLDAGLNRLVKLGSDGAVEVEYGPLTEPRALACDPVTGDAYVADGDNIVRVDREGKFVAEFTGFSAPADITFDGATEKLWVCDTGNGRLVKIDRDGNVILTFGDAGFPSPSSIDVNPVTGAVYAADETTGAIIKLNADGILEWFNVDDFAAPTDIVAGVYDDSVWIADAAGRRVVKLRSDETYVNNLGGFFNPVALSHTYQPR